MAFFDTPLQPVEIDISDIPNRLPIMSLRNTVVYPRQVIPLSVGREKSLLLVEKTLETNKIIGLVAQTDGTVDNPEESQIYKFGISALILKVLKLPDAQHIVVQGLYRMKIKKIIQSDPYFIGNVTSIKETNVEDVSVKAMVGNLKGMFQKTIDLASYLSPEQGLVVANTDQPGRLSDIIASSLNIPLTDKQEILETVNLKKRLEKVTRLLVKEMNVLELGNKIQSKIMGEIDKTQREYFLREQMKAIQKELGEEDERTVEIRELTEKVETVSCRSENPKKQERTDFMLHWASRCRKNVARKIYSAGIGQEIYSYFSRGYS